MDLSYIRGRTKQFRTTQNAAERQALLHKLAAHLGLVQPEENLTPDHQRKVIAELRRLGVSANYRCKKSGVFGRGDNARKLAHPRNNKLERPSHNR